MPSFFLIINKLQLYGFPPHEYGISFSFDADFFLALYRNYKKQ